MTDKVRSCWWNCYAPDDKSAADDEELVGIDAMEDAIAPLDEQTTAIRRLITRFELCYRAADEEAERIARAISTGMVPADSNERARERKAELENSYRILSQWCENQNVEDVDLNVGGISAETVAGFIGEPSPLKIWQVQRVVEKIGEALDPSRRYYRMALDVGDYGETGTGSVGDHYKDNADFLEKTRKTAIHDTLEGRKSKVSLAMAVDLLEPCHWDFVGALVAIFKAIGGSLQPAPAFACCAPNVKLSPLFDRVKIISNTLGAFWKNENRAEEIDGDLLAALGEPTPTKRWLAASLDKTIRLQLSLPFDVDPG